MKKAQVLESCAIILGVILAFLMQNTSLINYSTYLLALLIIFSTIYISLKKKSRSASEMFSGNPLELFGIVTIILLIISITNGLLSPLFFLLYFILFLLAFISEPVTIWIFLASIILFFLPDTFKNLDMPTFIKIGSLMLITPIAYFVGREFERRQLLNKKIEDKTDEIIHDAQVLREDDRPRNADEDEAIEEIIEEAESLKKDTEI